MSRMKSARWDELLARQMAGQEQDLCPNCMADTVAEDDLCRPCWNEINGQFGVGG